MQRAMPFMVIENEDLTRGMCSFGPPTAHASSTSCEAHTQRDRGREGGEGGREEGWREEGGRKEVRREGQTEREQDEGEKELMVEYKRGRETEKEGEREGPADLGNLN